MRNVFKLILEKFQIVRNAGQKVTLDSHEVAHRPPVVTQICEHTTRTRFFFLPKSETDTISDLTKIFQWRVNFQGQSKKKKFLKTKYLM